MVERRKGGLQVACTIRHCCFYEFIDSPTRETSTRFLVLATAPMVHGSHGHAHSTHAGRVRDLIAVSLSAQEEEGYSRQ